MSETSYSSKRVAKNTIMLYIRMVLLMLVNLYTARIVLNALGVEDYGLYSIVGAIVVFLGFINVSMSAAAQRFLSFYQGKGDNEELSSTFNSILIVQCIIALLILLIGESLGVLYIECFLNVDSCKLPIAHIVYQFSLFSFVSKTINIPYYSSIIANERMDAFAFISIAEGLLQLLVVFILQLLTKDRLVMYALMMFLSIVIVQCCYHIFSTRHFSECKFRRNWKMSTIRDIFCYSGWNLLGALSSVAIDQGVNMILNSFFGVVVNAARGISFQVSGAIASLSGSFQQALNPQIVKTYAEGERDKMHELIMSGTRFCFYLLLILVVPVFFNMQALLEIWLGKVPEDTETFCKLVLINSLFTVLSSSLLIGAMATGNIRKYQIIVASINLLNMPLSIIGLLLYKDPYLTVYIMIGLSVTAFIARLILTSQMISMSKLAFVKKTLFPATKVTTIMVLCALGIDHVVPIDNFGLLIVRVLLIMAIGLTIVACIGITRDERTLVVNFIKKKF